MDEPTETTEPDEALHPDEAAVLDGQDDNDETGEPDETAQSAPEPEPEPEAKTGLTEKQIEALYKKLDKAAASYMTAVQNVMEGHDLGLDPCPLCAYPGLVFPYAGDASDDVIKRQLTEAYFGMKPDELPEADDWVECVKCNGYGSLHRPTKVEGNAKIMCPDCSGVGCREKAQLQAQATVTQLPYTAAGTSTWTMPSTGTPDQWGRPPGHAHYGLEPAAVGLSV